MRKASGSSNDHCRRGRTIQCFGRRRVAGWRAAVGLVDEADQMGAFGVVELQRASDRPA
jgi:hypothetical protein